VEEQHRLPAGLRNIVRANSESLGRLCNCRACVVIHKERQQEGSAYSYTNRVRVWSKGRQLAEDVISQPAAGHERGPFVIEDRGKEGLLAYPLDGAQRVLTPEAGLSYSRGGGVLTIVAGDPQAPYGRHASVVHKYAALVLGETLEEKVNNDAGLGYHPAITPAIVEGLPCQLLEWQYPQAEMALKVWVVPSKGYMVKKLQTFHKGAVAQEWCVDLREYGDGLFWWEKVQHTKWAKGRIRSRTVARITDFEPNCSVDDSLFTLAGLDVPIGTEVRDRKLGLRYRYGELAEPSEDYVQLVVADSLRSAAGASTQQAAGGGDASPTLADGALSPRIGPTTERSGSGAATRPALWLAIGLGAVCVVATLGGILAVCRVLRFFRSVTKGR